VPVLLLELELKLIHLPHLVDVSTVASSTTSAAGWALFAVYSNGGAGVGTITFKYTDGNLVTYTVSTKSVTFYGGVASLTATQGKPIIRVNGTTGTTGSNYAVQLTAADSAGNPVNITSGYAIAMTSSDTTQIASSTDITGSCAADATITTALDCTLTGASTATAGKSLTLTFSYTDSNAIKYSSAALTYTMGGGTIASLTASFDKATYKVGDLVTMTLTAKDAKGLAVSDAKYTVFDTTTSTTVFATSAQLTTAPFGSAYVTFKNGVATATFYAPYANGDFNMTATTNNAIVAPTTDLATALQGVAVTGKFSIDASVTGGDASLALDAANAATDAANNAYDEAQNATQAAQDALAAVTALAAQVKSLIASVKSLTALVSKIKAKVGA